MDRSRCRSASAQPNCWPHSDAGSDPPFFPVLAAKHLLGPAATASDAQIAGRTPFLKFFVNFPRVGRSKERGSRIEGPPASMLTPRLCRSRSANGASMCCVVFSSKGVDGAQARRLRTSHDIRSATELTGANMIGRPVVRAKSQSGVGSLRTVAFSSANADCSCSSTTT
jgi:hypothetical protein